MRFLFLILKHVPERTWWIHDLYFISCFLFVCFEKYIDQFRFFHFLLILFRSRYLVHGLTKMCKSFICLCHSTCLFLFEYGMATPFGNIH
uniref:Uncharacterized protein n=1 Tax=Vitis vinifera TaxID=29760 RepID=F6I085_VITVI